MKKRTGMMTDAERAIGTVIRGKGEIFTYELEPECIYELKMYPEGKWKAEVKANEEQSEMITDYEHMMISALRYAIGRRTYIVEITVNYILSELPKLSDPCKHVMIDDIENAYSLGDEYDKADWMRLLKELKGEAK